MLFLPRHRIGSILSLDLQKSLEKSVNGKVGPSCLTPRFNRPLKGDMIYLINTHYIKVYMELIIPMIEVNIPKICFMKVHPEN